MRQLWVVLALAACGDDGSSNVDAGADATADAHADNFTVDGTIVVVGGGTAPATGKTMALWISSDNSGDYVYKYGEGTSTPTTFFVTVIAPVPAAATFSNVFGIAFIGLFDSTFSLPDGIVSDQGVLDTNLRGLTGQYAIIYNSGMATQPSWISAFPVGLSCGRCVKQTTGFDTFEPIACSLVQMQVGPMMSLDICNWT